MANNLRVFNTNSEYQSADLILPSVSYVVETDKVIYDITPPTPPVFQGKWKATYWDGRIISAECDSTSAITQGEIGNNGQFSLEIGDCVTSIGNRAFSNSYLTSIDIPDSVTSIGDSAFGNCNSLTSIVIPDSVTTIGNNAFSRCSGLTSCTIGSGVTSIEQQAFRGCTSLTSCTIGSGVTSIEQQAFNGCKSLASVTIPSGVTSIDAAAFMSCSSLTSITINATTPPTLGLWGVFDNTNNCPIYVPCESVEAYKSASGWSTYASRIQAIP